MIQKFLETLKKEVNSQFREIEKEVGYLFNLTEDIQVEIKKLGSDTLGYQIYFSMKITPCLKEKREEIFQFIMKANLLAKETGKAIIGLDDEEKFLTLSYVMPYEENYIKFKEKLEDFINYSLYWEGEIKNFQKKLFETIY
jgi:hypothetical protein